MVRPQPPDPQSPEARILAALDANPAAREPLLRALLTDEVLKLPVQFTQLKDDLTAIRRDLAELKNLTAQSQAFGVPLDHPTQPRPPVAPVQAADAPPQNEAEIALEKALPNLSYLSHQRINAFIRYLDAKTTLEQLERLALSHATPEERQSVAEYLQRAQLDIPGITSPPPDDSQDQPGIIQSTLPATTQFPNQPDPSGVAPSPI